LLESEPLTARYVRQDEAYKKAKREGFRSRAVYKLDDLLKRTGKLDRGSVVLELGAWPGGWLQRLANHVGPTGRVVGIDLREIEELGPPVELLQADFTLPETLDRLRDALAGSVDAVLSDAAPKLTGVVPVDRAMCEELYDAGLEVAVRVLKPGGRLILKGFPGPEAQEFRLRLRPHFSRIREVRPDGKRATSKEFYWVALGFRPEAESRDER